MGRKVNNQDLLIQCDVKKHKIMTTMETEKRERLIDCAMKEFTQGYAMANTDEIVKEAGISKGLLFHYFGSKRGLFLFLLRYALDIVNEEYAKVILESGDFLENILRVCKLVVNLTFEHLVVYRFLVKAHFSISEVFPEGLPEDMTNASEALLQKILKHSSKSFFKPDIDYEKAQNIILWTMNGFNESLFSYGTDIEVYQANYDRCLKELDEYLQLLRKVLYR